MKILITTELYTPAINGVVTSVVNLRSELKKMGHDVRILTLSETKQSFQEDGVTYISSVGAGRIYPGARVAISCDNKYLKDLVRWHPDIIHSQCEFSTFLMARYIAKKLGIPIVHTYHTVYEDYTHYFSPNKKWGKAMAALFTRKILSHADCIIAPTDKVRSLLIGYGLDKEIEVVPTGIDLERFNVSISNIEMLNLREKIGIPITNKVLIFVGRLAKEKNLEEIFFFLSRINKQDFTLLIVGDGPHREKLEEYAKKLDIAKNVIFTGMIQPHEIVSYYRLGDVFVSASNSETQGLTYIEALANGVPALCREDPCLENVIEDGINGWQYTSFEQFSEKLDFVFKYNEKYKYLCENAVSGAMHDYSSVSFAHKVEKIYKKTINHYLIENEGTSVLIKAKQKEIGA